MSIAEDLRKNEGILIKKDNLSNILKPRLSLSVMDCRETATSREDFIDQMKSRGYGVDWQDSHKYITFTDLERQSQGEKQCKVRNNKLEKYYAVDFGKESLEHGFEINARREAERTATTERARQQLDRTAVAENSGADERARARQLLDRTAVAEDSRTEKAYQPDNTAVTEERLSNLRLKAVSGLHNWEIRYHSQ